MKHLPLVLLCAFLVILGAFGFLHGATQQSSFDLSSYQKIADGSADFASESLRTITPVTAAIIAFVGDMPIAFNLAWFVLVLGTATAVCIVIYRRDGKWAGVSASIAILASAVLAGPQLFFARYDVITGLLLLAAGSAFAARRMIAGIACSALAASLAPSVLWLLPCLFFCLSPQQRKACLRRIDVTVLLVCVICFGVLGLRETWLLLEGNVRNLWHGLQIESLWSAMLMLWQNVQHDTIAVTWRSPMHELASAPRWIVFAAQAAAASGATYLLYRARTQVSVRTHASWLLTAGIAWLLLVGSIFSSQFILWLAPLAFWLSLSTWRSSPSMSVVLGALTAGVLLCTASIYPEHYFDLVNQTSALPVLAILLRGLCLLGVVIVCLRDVTSRPAWLRLPRLSARTEISIGLALLVGLFFLQQQAAAVFTNVQYQYPGKAPVPTTLPIVLKSDASPLTISMKLDRGPLQAGLFMIRPDDCIESLTINGKAIDQKIANFCVTTLGKLVNLAPHLRAGANTLTFVVKDTGGKGGLTIDVSRKDPLIATVRLLMLGVIALFGWRFIDRTLRTATSRDLARIFLGGSILRIVYAFITPYQVRAYDASEHYAYIAYVLEHWRIPPASGAWEFHQAPAYYFAAAIWERAMDALGLVPLFYHEHTQLFSLLLSLVTLWAAMWCGLLLIGRKQRMSLSIFCGLMATAPSLVFFSSRVTNDALYTCLAFIGLAAMIRFWTTKKARDWMTMSLLIVAAFLTKANAALLFVFALGTAAWEHLRGKKTGLSRLLFLQSSFAIGLLSSWLVIMRLLEEKTSKFVSFGHSGMNPKLLIADNANPLHYITFNPLAVLTTPFNNNWSMDARREYFFEYIFRSAFFGEFNFSTVSPLVIYSMLLAGMVLVLFLLRNIIWEWRKPRLHSRLMLVVLAGSLLSTLLFRMRFGCPCNQDFRFAIITLVPMGYFLCARLESQPPLLRNTLALCLTTLCLASTLFVFSLIDLPS